MRASLQDQGRDSCRYISCLSCISLMSANSASVVVIFINWLLGEHSKILSIRNIGNNGRWRWWKSKVRGRTDFILRWRLNPFALVSDRTVPPTLPSLDKADLPLTLCQQIPATHHFSSFTCLLCLDSHVAFPKTHTNKYKTHRKAKALSVQWVYPRTYQHQLQSRNLQPVRGAISMPGLKRDQMSHGVREKMSAQTQHTIFLG